MRRALAAAGVALSLCLAGCSTGSGTTATGPDESQQQDRAATSPDDHDLQLLSSVHDAVKEWNATTGPLVKDFRDPAVTAEAFSASARPAIATIKAIAQRIETGYVGLHDTGLAQALAPVARAYGAEAIDFELLVEAVERSDDAGQRAIADRLTADGTQKAKDGLAVVAYLRQKYGNEFADAFAG